MDYIDHEGMETKSSDATLKNEDRPRENSKEAQGKPQRKLNINDRRTSPNKRVNEQKNI